MSPGGRTGSAPALAPLAPVLAAGGPEMLEQLALLEQRLERAAAGHGDVLGDHAASTLAAGGKRLRPLLVFLCGGHARGAGEDGDPLLHAATAVELLHMATLVHDDVLDRATLRRGRPTVVQSAGRGAAVATGDLLLARAFAELVRSGSSDAVRALSSASTALVRGELMQRADAWSDSVTPARYLERCELKTARLFDAACRLGALLGEPGPERAEGLGAFGASIGVAFQLLDDVLDIAGPTERTGKPRGADLLDGTVTLPLILARRRDPSLAALDLRAAVTTPERAAETCERIVATGALEQARARALDYVRDAKASLRALDLDRDRVAALELVAEGVVERYA